MNTRAQDNAIERLAHAHGRVLVRHGYADRSVRVTFPNLQHGLITEAGTFVDAGVDASAEAVEWSQ